MFLRCLLKSSLQGHESIVLLNWFLIFFVHAYKHILYVVYTMNNVIKYSECTNGIADFLTLFYYILFLIILYLFFTPFTIH